MSRLIKFLEESAISKALSVELPDSSQEYEEEEVVSALKTLSSAIEELHKGDKNKTDKAALRDFTENLRKWVKLYKDRFGEDGSAYKKATSLLSGKAPKKFTAPIETPAGALPIKLAAKSGALQVDPETISYLDKQEEKPKKKK